MGLHLTAFTYLKHWKTQQEISIPIRTQQPNAPREGWSPWAFSSSHVSFLWRPSPLSVLFFRYDRKYESEGLQPLLWWQGLSSCLSLGARCWAWPTTAVVIFFSIIILW
jgi:hypothetical protein